MFVAAHSKRNSQGGGGGVIRAFNSLTSFFNCRHLCLFLIHSFWLPLLIGWLVSRHDRHLPPPFYRYLAISTSFRAFFSNFVYICFVLSINHTRFSEIYEILEESVANWWKYRTPNLPNVFKKCICPLGMHLESLRSRIRNLQQFLMKLLLKLGWQIEWWGLELVHTLT